MLLENESNSIHGNTVLAPKTTALPKEKVKIKKKVKSNSEENRQRLLKAMKFAGTLGSTFVIAFTILFRYSSIYSTQKELIQVSNEISNLAEENEGLKVQLLKYNNISYIEEVATKQLKMVTPVAGSATYCNLNSIELPHEEKNTESASSKFLDKLKSFLF